MGKGGPSYSEGSMCAFFQFSSYEAIGNLSDPKAILDRISTAVEKAKSAKIWRITNPAKASFVFHCPSGPSLCILPGGSFSYA